MQLHLKLIPFLSKKIFTFLKALIFYTPIGKVLHNLKTIKMQTTSSLDFSVKLSAVGGQGTECLGDRARTRKGHITHLKLISAKIASP